MEAAAEIHDSAAAFMTEVVRIREADPSLSTLGAGMLAATSLGIADDSRAFARALGIAHALVLREVQALADMGRLTVTRRDERTQRCGYALAQPFLQAVNDRA